MEWQLRVAAGQALPVPNQDDISFKGHAIEARICAENVDRGFLPAAGTLRRMRLPSGAKSGIGGGEVTTRVDTGVMEGDAVSMHYDPMIAKVGGSLSNRRQRKGTARAWRAESHEDES